jgi:transcriptional regulator with XRE-family HTH domain
MMLGMPQTTPVLRGRYVRLRLEKLDERARALGLETDAQIADRLGLDRAGISRLRSGDSNPGERFIAAALGELGVSFEYLFEIVEAS